MRRGAQLSKQKVSAQEEGATPDAPLDFDKLLKLIENKIVKGSFPAGKLKNRLKNLGVKEFIEKEPAIHTYGFPFKFVNHLDEAILAMGHYLDRFRRQGGELYVYAVNRLPKGEDKTLSYWQSEKARLYIELQNIILLLNGVAGMRSEVARIFAFRKMDDIAFLTQSAISAMNEQAALGIKVGLLFRESFRPPPKMGTISDTLIIDYRPALRSKNWHNFYELRTLLDESNPHDLPYQGRCTAKWFESRGAAEEQAEHTSPLLSLFETKWEEVGKNTRGIARYTDSGPSGSQSSPERVEQDEAGEGHFRRAAAVMYRAFTSTDDFNDLPANRDKQARAIVDRINKTVITNDLIRFERAISAFEQSSTIYAVDPTSVKATLKVHESEPLYRRWIRTSLNGVLKKGSQKSLNRIYILNDKGELANDEFQALKRIMHYYFDYCNYDLSAMTPVINAHEEQPCARIPRWLPEARLALRGRVSLYVTTVSALEEFTQRRLARDAPKEVFDAFRDRLPRMLQDVLKKKEQSSELLLSDTHEALKRLDFLYTGDMIYNFLTDRADLSEQSFEAYLYRKFFDVAKEKRILFDVAGSGLFDAKMQDLRSYQMPHRLSEFAASLLDYAEKYGDNILKPLLNPEGEEGRDPARAAEAAELRKLIKRVTEKLGQPAPADEQAEGEAKPPGAAAATTPQPPPAAAPSGFTETDAKNLLKARRGFEDTLYKHFHPIFSYFYELIEFLSVKVELFGPDEAGRSKRRQSADPTSLEDVFPFSECRPEDGGVERLAAIIREKVDERLAGDFASLPKPPPEARPAGDEAEAAARPVVFLSYASEDRVKVKKIANRLAAAGYDPWLDEEKLPLAWPWKNRIERAIESSDFFMSCMSKTSLRRKSVAHEELRMAMAIEKRVFPDYIFIVPVLLDDSPIPKAWAPRTVGRLFAGDELNAEVWNRLLRTVEEALGERGLSKVQRSPARRASKGSPRTPPPALDGRRKKR
jgi:hypothetical protein